MPKSIFSFFSGVGLLDLGFDTAGYDIVFVNEFKEEFLNASKDFFDYDELSVEVLRL